MNVFKPIKKARYNPDYAYLEDVEMVAQLEEPTVHKQLSGEAFDDATATWMSAREISREPTMTDDDVKQAIIFDYRRGCSCEHDCCGHYHGGVWKISKADDIWYWITSYAPNY